MKIWIPYIEGGSGADIYTCYMAGALRKLGNEVFLQRFNRYYQFTPQLLSNVPAPGGTDIILTNTASGFVFVRHGAKMIAIEHLFILDPALKPYKSSAQRLYHEFMMRRFVTRTVEAADAVVAVSQYTADALSKGLKVPPPQVILNAVDTEFFTPVPSGKASLDKRPVRLLFVGNLTRRKGADLLKPIMERLGSGFELHYTEGLRRHRFDLQTSDTIKPLGRLNQEQIRDAYRWADILLFPSRGEGMSCAVMESMACGTPVVAAALSSLPEALAEGGGRLCQPDDADDFASSIHEMLPRLDTLSKQARQVAERRFSLKRMILEYLVLFEGLIAQN